MCPEQDDEFDVVYMPQALGYGGSPLWLALAEAARNWDIATPADQRAAVCLVRDAMKDANSDLRREAQLAVVTLVARYNPQLWHDLESDVRRGLEDLDTAVREAAALALKSLMNQ